MTALNPQQEAAVSAKANPCLVLAGPGSGKTKVLVHRIIHFVKACEIPANKIYAVTFTNRAANEMKKRTAAFLTQAVSDQINMGTFHHICCKILRKFVNKIPGHNLKQNFNIIDASDQKAVIAKFVYFLDQVEGFKAEPTPKKVAKALKFISDCKNTQQDENETLRITEEDEKKKECTERRAMAKLYNAYQQYLRENNLMDFDDLLVYTCLLLGQRQEVKAYYATACRALLIDEFQDTNKLQYQILQSLSSVHKNVFVVGDHDQSIYGWRHAEVYNIQKFINEFNQSGLQIFKLEQNYRSTKNIVAASSAVIDIASVYNSRQSETFPKKNLFSTNTMGPPICMRTEGAGPEAESDFICEEIKKLVATKRTVYKDFAVLLRTNAKSRAVEEAMMKNGIPYAIVGALRFYDRMEIKDLLGYIRLAENPYDSVALLRIINVPKRGIGDKTKELISETAKAQNTSPYEVLYRLCVRKERFKNLNRKKELCEFVRIIEELKASRVKNLNPDALLLKVLQDTDYLKYLKSNYSKDFDSRKENIDELLNVCAEFTQKRKSTTAAQEDGARSPLTEFLESITLHPDNINEDQSISGNHVTISTFHSAKGAEFGVVFLPGVEEGTLPFYYADTPERIEEERRLLYVGMTRAKAMLYISFTGFRFENGELQSSVASQFLYPLQQLLDEEDEKGRPQNSRFITSCALSKLLTPSDWDMIKPMLQDITVTDLGTAPPVRPASRQSTQQTTPSTPTKSEITSLAKRVSTANPTLLEGRTPTKAKFSYTDALLKAKKDVGQSPPRQTKITDFFKQERGGAKTRKSSGLIDSDEDEVVFAVDPPTKKRRTTL